MEVHNVCIQKAATLGNSVISKAIECGVPALTIESKEHVINVPERFGEKLTYVHRLAIYKKCSFKADGDSVGL